jgi:hypothetical protein
MLRAAVLGVFTGWLAACEHAPAVAPTQSTLPSAGAASVATLPALRAPEAAFVALANQLPSSAGFFYDRNDDLVVLVTDTSDGQHAAAAVRQLVATRSIALSPEKSRSPRIRVLIASYSFRQLSAWRDSIGNYVDNTAGAGVAWLDVDEEANRLTLGVLGSANRSALLAAARRMGVDANAVRFRDSEQGHLDVGRVASTSTASAASEHYGATALRRRTTTSITSSQSTLIGGLEIGLWAGADGGACTAGFAVKHYSSGVTKSGILTASHCTHTTFGFDGDSMSQNSAGTKVGREYHDPSYYQCGLFHCRPSDAAFIATNAGVSIGLGQVAKWAGGGYDSLTYDNTSSWVVTRAGSDNVYVGTQTSWVGRTTGFHSGVRVTNTCVDFWLDILLKTTCAMVDSLPASAGGDSGGPVFVILNAGNEIQAVGTVSGHIDAYHMYWSQVSRAGNDFTAENSTLTFNPATISAPTLSGSVDGSNHPALSWTSVAGVLTYSVFRFDYDASCNSTTSGTGYLGSTTLTAFGDASVTVGGGPGCPHSQYWVTASTATQFSGPSNLVTFTTP